METVTPQCGICKKFYSANDDDGSGLCKTCRPTVSQPLLKQELVQPGKFGVSNAQLIPAMKQAIQEQSPEQLRELKATYFYIFERSIRYLRKDEREYIKMHLGS
ncbi:hypothetical protein [Methylomusa anaerophila]|uniref:Uncharacterized protein n=1 Tax=Methylomusa anaerophila TaxID=1930071 RepID=A0A348AF37_9FIRM|nr:hypothetical protein [Methylomusa anaerophila]BBB89685.1 hypothetical protein MAMMFC1_00318 [Methylomusa anaerophila]